MYILYRKGNFTKIPNCISCNLSFETAVSRMDFSTYGIFLCVIFVMREMPRGSQCNKRRYLDLIPFLHYASFHRHLITWSSLRSTRMQSPYCLFMMDAERFALGEIEKSILLCLVTFLKGVVHNLPFVYKYWVIDYKWFDNAINDVVSVLFYYFRIEADWRNAVPFIVVHKP